MNVRKGTAEIDISRIVNPNGILLLSLQERHTKGVAQPITGFANPDRQGCEGISIQVSLGKHPDPPPGAAFVTDLGATILAIEGLAFIDVTDPSTCTTNGDGKLDFAAHTLRPAGHHFRGTVHLGKFPCLAFGGKRKAGTPTFAVDI